MDNNSTILSKIKLQIEEIDPNARIILFGSRARGDARKNSDWDFLILTKKEVTIDLKNKISDALFETELETDEVLTSIVQNDQLWQTYSGTPIFNNIAQEGIEL